MIRKRGSKWCLFSKDGTKNLGCFPTKGQAEKREKQVVFFGNVEKSSGGKGSLAAKVKKKSLLK